MPTVRRDGRNGDNALYEYNILRVGQFDFECLGSEDLFNSMPLEELQKYPVSPSSLYHLREYNSAKRGKMHWRAIDCATDIKVYVQNGPRWAQDQ